MRAAETSDVWRNDVATADIALVIDALVQRLRGVHQHPRVNSDTTGFRRCIR